MKLLDGLLRIDLAIDGDWPRTVTWMQAEVDGLPAQLITAMHDNGHLESYFVRPDSEEAFVNKMAKQGYKEIVATGLFMVWGLPTNG